MAATQPIEISNPLGSGTCMVIRAGGSTGKNSAKRRLSSGKFDISETRTVVFTTRFSWLPPAFRTVSRFRKACRACVAKSEPAGAPVSGSIPGWPDTNSRSPVRTACEYGPIVFEPGTSMICFLDKRTLLLPGSLAVERAMTCRRIVGFPLFNRNWRFPHGSHRANQPC
jgi:hypothetical protein